MKTFGVSGPGSFNSPRVARGRLGEVVAYAHHNVADNLSALAPVAHALEEAAVAPVAPAAPEVVEQVAAIPTQLTSAEQ